MLLDVSIFYHRYQEWEMLSLKVVKEFRLHSWMLHFFADFLIEKVSESSQIARSVMICLLV